MAEMENNGMPQGEDTQTRKTVKLKLPTQKQGGLQIKTPAIIDPLGNRDTDTGNLDILSDTQTRKTVKLKPVTAPAAPKPSINIDAARPAVAVKPVAAPATPGKPAPAVAVKPVAAPQTVAESADDETVKVSKVAAPATPAVVLPQTKEEDDETVKVSKVAAPAAPAVVLPATPKAPGELKSSAPTIKLQPAAAVTAAAAEPAAPEEDDKTVKMKRPARPMPMPNAPEAATPAAAEVPETPVEEAAETNAPEEIAEVAAEEQEPEIHITFDEEPEETPSKFYTIVAAVSLLLITASAVLGGLQFFQLFMEKN